MAKLKVKLNSFGKWLKAAVAPLSFITGILSTLLAIFTVPMLSSTVIAALDPSILNPSSSFSSGPIARSGDDTNSIAPLPSSSPVPESASVKQVSWNNNPKEMPQVLEVTLPTKQFVPDASVAVTLDEHISLEQYPMVKKLRFQTDLDPENPTIALSMVHSGDQEANVIVEVETAEHSQVMLYQINHSSQAPSPNSAQTFNASFSP